MRCVTRTRTLELDVRMARSHVNALETSNVARKPGVAIDALDQAR